MISSLLHVSYTPAQRRWRRWTDVRQLLGYERFEHPELVALMNGLYRQEWSQFHNRFQPTFKLFKRDKQGSMTVRICEKPPHTPYQRLLDRATFRKRPRQNCTRNTGDRIKIL